MRTVKMVAKGLVALVALVALMFVGLVSTRSDRRFEAPDPQLRASSEPSVIARGRYLVNGPAHCVSCHGASAARGRGAEAVQDEPLSGGLAFHLPIGTIRAPNITPDRETGIGRYRDEVLARALRHGVGADGRALLPFMPFAHLSDEDLVAVLSYLRSRPAVRHAVPASSYNPLGLVVRALVLEPRGPSREVPRAVQAEPTAEYGRYLVNDVANCAGCHTRRDMRTGEPIGAPLAGGQEMESHDVPGLVFVTPNLTPDPETGRITRWTEDAFVARFRGPIAHGTPMPWPAYARMSDADLRAIHRYLRTLRPVHGGAEDQADAPVASNRQARR